MKVNIKRYFEEREKMLATQTVPGPVITISRTYGCDEGAVLKALIGKLNALGPGGMKQHLWKYVDKEILDESAKVLGITPIDVEHRVFLHHSAVVNELLSGFSKDYNLSDKEIINNVKDVIDTYARRGNVVIVGRGGVGVVRYLRNSLHIQLTAPLEARAKWVSEKQELSREESIDLIRRMDSYRRTWTEHLIEQPIDDGIFDLSLNMQHLSVEEIADIIVSLMQKRRLVPLHHAEEMSVY
ncbi:cytidylate kinase-like family protein [Reichenbachiella ulvae]|uniref:Cytidylate kinase-like family protein n=1 Tax=Reichenbachiella ulvae TaxID=2980104 RepID=A0ABT3CN87_9BACT|nr:cytidylate kinase-like family protein [Reichenbachiella ulvae]MCV9385211.1 cytidylate kinase-like family protein [Reichenbachiella ulvae]